MVIAPDLVIWGFPGGTSSKEPACQCGRCKRCLGLVPRWGRFPGGGHGNPLQYSCLENPVDRGVWRATVRRVAKSQTQLSDRALTHVPDSLPCKGSPSSGSSQALKKFPCAHTCGTETLHGQHPWVPPPAVVSSPKYIPSRRSAQVVPAS